ncbi:MAG: hypothetical protein ACTSQJ_00295 [Promethearchaeota archaeon]
MSVYTPPDVKGKPSIAVILNPNKAADADISLDNYDIKFDLDHPYPITSIILLDFDRTAPGFTASKKYTTNDYGTAGSLASGKMAIIDEDTFRIGDATNAANHDYILILNYIGGRIKNT